MPSNIVVPEVGESIVDARVAKWLRKEGDVVSAGDPLVELETDKIDLEVGAPQAGVLSRIDRKDGEDVKVGEVLGVIDESKAAAAAPAAAQAADARRPAEPAAVAPPAPQDKSPRSTPTARKHDIDLASVKGSGDAGRVMRRDVEQAAAGGNGKGARSVPTSEVRKPKMPTPMEPPRRTGDRTEERVRMSKRRATIAKRLVEAQSTAAMLTTFNEVDMSAVMSLRERHKATFKERHGVGLGIASFFVKASVREVREF